MAYSALISVVPMLVFFALWLPLPLIRGLSMLRPNASLLLLATLPANAGLSTLWSDYPLHTLYLAAAFAVMLVCVIIMQRAVRFCAWVNGTIAGIVITLVVALSSGRFHINPISGTPELMGYFGSKNMVGLFAAIGVIFAAARLMMRPRIAIVLIGGVSMLLCLTCLFLSHSGTSWIALLLASCVIVPAYGIARLPREHRMLPTLVVALVLVVGVTAVALLGGAADILVLLGKDETLTGRTYLWSEGLRVAQQKPWLGQGYGAFWVQGRPQAERYWHEFFVENRTGFHFHNLWIQTWVDLGLLGCAVMAIMFVATFIAVLRLSLRTAPAAQIALLAGLLTLFCLRTAVEVDMLGPFSVGVMLFYAIILRAGDACKAAATDAVPPTDVSKVPLPSHAYPTL